MVGSGMDAVCTLKGHFQPLCPLQHALGLEQRIQDRIRIKYMCRGDEPDKHLWKMMWEGPSNACQLKQSSIMPECIACTVY